MEYVLKRSLMAKSKLAVILKGPDGDTQYCCVECPARFTNKEKMELHLCFHNKEYRYLCGICGTGLKRKEHLDRHTQEHQEVRPHVCPECGKAFKRKEHLNIHRSIHSGKKNEVCPFCSRSFYRKDHLQKHLQTHNKLFAEQNMYQVSEQEFLDIKQEVVEDEDMKPIITDIVGGVLEPDVMMEIQGNDKSLNTSVANYNNERPYACPLCSKTYKRKDHLKLHSVTHLEKDKICSECGKAFHKEEQLLNHMNLHLKSYPATEAVEDAEHLQAVWVEQGDHDNLMSSESELLVPRSMSYKAEQRPHECPVCHRRFKRKQHLKVHANIHFKDQPTVWCSLCSEGFFNNYQFENHQCSSSSHGTSDEEARELLPEGAKKENKYPDDDDVQVIEDNTNSADASFELLREELSIPTPRRVYVCKYCAKPFKRKDHYKIHLHIHTGVKSFFCPDCGKGFYRKDHLQKHTLVHAKTKPKPKKSIPDLYPIGMLPKKEVDIKPEITIHAPSNTKLRMPLQIKVPYQMVVSMDNGEQRAVTVDPQSGIRRHEIVS